MCHTYFLTVPLFHSNLQFLVSIKVLFNDIELGLQGADKIKKIKNKLLLTSTEKRMG